jgi:hypothetical protein
MITMIVTVIEFVIVNFRASSVSNGGMWLPNDGSDAPKIPSGKGKRLIILHVGTRSESLIDGCALVFLAKSKEIITYFFISMIQDQ